MLSRPRPALVLLLCCAVIGAKGYAPTSRSSASLRHPLRACTPHCARAPLPTASGDLDADAALFTIALCGAACEHRWIPTPSRLTS